MVVGAGGEPEPPGMRLYQPDRKRLDKALRQQLEDAAKPPKEPGLIARLLGRGRKASPPELALDDPRLWRGRNDVTPPPESPPPPRQEPAP